MIEVKIIAKFVNNHDNQYHHFWFIFQVILCSHYNCDFWRNGSRPKLTIYKRVSDNYKKCLSIGNFGILYVVCSGSAAYTSLCRGLKYLQRAP